MLIRSGDVRLCSFEAVRSDALYDIRNHPSVRSQMRDPKPIPREAHERWVRENLIDARRVHLFLVEANENPVGIALLRNFRGDTAEIGVMIVDAARRPLVCYKAAILVGYYGFEVLDLKSIYSYVPLRNTRALEFNLHCGFERTGNDSEIYHELILTQGQARSHPTHRQFRKKYKIEVF